MTPLPPTPAHPFPPPPPLPSGPGLDQLARLDQPGGMLEPALLDQMRDDCGAAARPPTSLPDLPAERSSGGAAARPPALPPAARVGRGDTGNSPVDPPPRPPTRVGSGDSGPEGLVDPLPRRDAQDEARGSLSLRSADLLSPPEVCGSLATGRADPLRAPPSAQPALLSAGADRAPRPRPALSRVASTAKPKPERRRARGARGLSASAASAHVRSPTAPALACPPCDHPAHPYPAPRDSREPREPREAHPHPPMHPPSRSDDLGRAETAAFVAPSHRCPFPSQPGSSSPAPDQTSPAPSHPPPSPGLAAQPSDPEPQTNSPQPGRDCRRRASSHVWASDALLPPPSARRATTPVVEHLDALSSGEPVPRGPRSPPPDAQLAWGRPRTSTTSRPLRVLVLFAGPCEAASNLPACLREAGCDVTAIDTKLGGSAHDVLRRMVADRLLERIRASEFEAVFIATPCSSYSVRHDPQLRTRDDPEGDVTAPPAWRAYVAKHNLLAQFTARAVDACRITTTPVALENPSDRGDTSSPASWPAFSDHGSLWRMPAIAAALGAYAATFSTFAQCSLSSLAQKWTTIAAAGALSPALAGLGHPRYGCAHGKERHSQTLSGYDELGRSRAGQAAAYPAPMNDLLTSAVVAAALARRRQRDATPTSSGGQARSSALPPAPPPAQEGRVADGPALGQVAHFACEAARHVPQRFAHRSHHVPAHRDELRAEPFPGELCSPVVSSKPTSTCKALRRRPLPKGRSACGWTGCCSDPAPAPKPPADIPIADLFLEGVYASEVLSWFALADVAVAAIRQGRRPAPIPTRVIGQDQLQPWARGIVWDCRNHLACMPVARSTRRTSFPGSRQLDRAEVRRVASLLDWHDHDIIDQIGEGGLEPRSECSLDIVLTFHHESLLSEIDMAEASVASHIGEEWVDAPVRHLPFVPCRLQPRGVVLQHRTRLLPDGVTLEEYEKPRITSDSSFGGEDSVNAAIPDKERSVVLPSAQSLGRGWAIAQSAFPAPSLADPDPVHVEGYCIDAESAYSFCPIQEADLWTQCFCWWDSSASAGVAVDRRLGFGGAFAPNRFERISTFVAAYAQHLQTEFDSAQPLPPSTQTFVAEREGLQALGKLPPGPAQLSPKFLQVFMDDFTGVAATDLVHPPSSVAHITVQPEHMVAAGCSPAHPDSRVHVHARLTILALTTLGLHAAPHKVACGTPLPALGLLMDGRAQLIRCPEGKRRAVLADASSQHAAALSGGDVDRARARRLVGRLANLAQVAPELRGFLHGGYAVAEAAWPGGGGRRGHGHLHLRSGSPAHEGWLSLLSQAQTILGADTGVQMAPRTVALPRHLHGTLTSVTDASGEDGFGGYGFLADRPKEVFLLSQPWPDFALLALQASSDPDQARLRDAVSPLALPHLSMPAAELFAQLALPIAVSRLSPCSAVFAVGDCGPAAGVLADLHSRNAQMRVLSAVATAQPWPWVSAKVPREANVDADRLSHPSLAEAVAADAEAADLVVTPLVLLDEDWGLLREAIEASSGGQRRRQKRRRSH